MKSTGLEDANSPRSRVAIFRQGLTKITVLNQVFELFQQIGAVSSESEFSKDWLCRGECYMLRLRFNRVKPRVGTLAMYVSKLKHFGRSMTATEHHTAPR